MRNGWIILMSVMLLAAGCESYPKREMRLEQERDAAVNENEQLKKQVETLTETNRQQSEQVAALQGMGDDRLKQLFTVDRIEIDSRSGGLNTDGEPGQDAVVVFIKPKDKAGSTLKAAGSIRVQILTLPPKAKTPICLGEAAIPAEKAGEHFAAGPLTRHYRIVTPLTRRPKRKEAVIDVRFTDVLTGKTFTARRDISFPIPPKPVSPKK